MNIFKTSTLKRVYKEDSPSNTIIKIRKILQEMNVITSEMAWSNFVDDVYSVRVETFEEDGCIGQNGKGRDKLFALASAHAELIERMQNGIIILSKSLWEFMREDIKRDTGFYFFPDEKEIGKDEFLNLPIEYLRDVTNAKDMVSIREEVGKYFDDLCRNGHESIVSVPFWDYTLQKLVYLPLCVTLLATGSNGMAAGNTEAEAIYQGLCELLERYAASTIYHNRLTPPIIPDEYLKQFPLEMQIINDIKAKGYQVIIKDFCCNKNLPVIASLIINEKERKYRLNVGADTSFQVALSRTLTEILQGIDSVDRLESYLLPIPEQEYDYFFEDDEISVRNRHKEFEKFSINNRGLFPYSLFQDCPSYQFSPNVYGTRASYNEEVKYLIHLMEEQGSHVLIRNVSFLGFPSYYLYATGISVAGRKIEEFKIGEIDVVANRYSKEWETMLFPLNQFLDDVSRIQKFTDSIENSNLFDYDQIRTCEILRIEFQPECYWNHLPLSYFMALLYYRSGNFNMAIKNLEIFMRSTNNANNNYYLQVLQYYSYLEKNKSVLEIERDIPAYILKEYKVENIFKNIDIPTCPNCNQCTLNKYCLTKGRIHLSKKIINKMKSRVVSQGVSF